MDQLIEFIMTHAEWAPYIIFSALLLAGINIPVSEDGMLFISALLAANNPEQTSILFAAIFFGAYFSDMICYGVGRFLGPKIWSNKFFASIASKDKVERLEQYFERYGPATLFFGRFIPFGVRNAMFLTAGLSKMNFSKFAFFDFLACLLSCSTFFYLYYTFGEQVIEYVKKGNIVVFSLACIIVIAIILVKKKNDRKSA